MSDIKIHRKRPKAASGVKKPLMFLSLVMMLVVGADAAAHKVNMFAYADGNDIFVEGYFSDGKKARKSEVLVFDSAQQQLLAGRTDEEGQFSFRIPKLDDLRIRLNAGQGHQTEYTLTAAEMSGDDIGVEPAAVSVPEELADQAQAVANVNSAADLRPIVRKAVGRAIRPLMRELSELKEQRSASDIIGGIGFIAGIIGVFFYIKARKLLDQRQRPDDNNVS